MTDYLMALHEFEKARLADRERGPQKGSPRAVGGRRPAGGGRTDETKPKEATRCT